MHSTLGITNKWHSLKATTQRLLAGLKQMTQLLKASYLSYCYK